MKNLLAPIKWIFRDRKRVIILAVILLIAGWYIVTHRKSNAPQYQTATAEKGTLINSVTASGTVTTSNIQAVTTQASGYIKQMYVSDGSQVTKGQKIAELELDLVGSQRNAAAYASYVNAMNGLKTANNTLRSATSARNLVYDQIQGHATDESFQMIDTRTKAEVAYDNAWNGLASAQANLASSQLSYNQTSSIITAPVSGIIKLSVAEGYQLSSAGSTTANVTNQSIATITTPGNPLISVAVSEIDVPKIKTGQKVTITFDSLPDSTFTGKVLALDKMGSTSSGVTSYTTLIGMDTNNDQIYPQMAATAVIINDIKTDVLLVPTAAIQTVSGQSSVRVLKNGVITTVPVEIGESNETQTIITSGLNEGDTVVTGTTSAATTTSGTSVFSNRGFGGIGGGGGAVRINRGG